MKEIINNYMTKNYKFCHTTKKDFKLLSITDNKFLFIAMIATNIYDVFGVNEEEAKPIINQWCDEEYEKLIKTIKNHYIFINQPILTEEELNIALENWSEPENA